jgi:RNA polymerase sigma-70 factor (ECF subfamily)
MEDRDSVVMRAKNGSHEAFAELVRLYQHDVRAVICRQLGRGPAADDVAQDVFVHAFQNIATFRAEGSIRSWLLGITRNLIVSHFRQQARHSSITLADLVDRLQIAECDDDAIDMDLQMQQLDVLRGCVKQLSDDQRRIVEAFYFENLPAAVIARQMERKPGTIRMSLLRIRDVLRRCVEQKTGSWR